MVAAIRRTAVRRCFDNELTLPRAGFVRLRVILALIPISTTAWWSGVKTGRFPRPIKIGPRTTAWRVEDIRGLISALADGVSVG